MPYTSHAQPLPTFPVRELIIPLSDGLYARIPHPLSPEDYKLLLDTLTLWHGRLTRKEDVIMPGVFGG